MLCFGVLRAQACTWRERRGGEEKLQLGVRLVSSGARHSRKRCCSGPEALCGQRRSRLCCGLHIVQNGLAVGSRGAAGPGRGTGGCRQALVASAGAGRRGAGHREGAVSITDGERNLSEFLSYAPAGPSMKRGEACSARAPPPRVIFKSYLR